MEAVRVFRTYVCRLRERRLNPAVAECCCLEAGAAARREPSRAVASDDLRERGPIPRGHLLRPGGAGVRGGRPGAPGARPTRACPAHDMRRSLPGEGTLFRWAAHGLFATAPRRIRREEDEWLAHGRDAQLVHPPTAIQWSPMGCSATILHSRLARASVSSGTPPRPGSQLGRRSGPHREASRASRSARAGAPAR
jgi:hypothetical protein